MHQVAGIIRGIAEVALGGFLIPLVVILILFAIVFNLIKTYPIPIALSTGLLLCILLLL